MGYRTDKTMKRLEKKETIGKGMKVSRKKAIASRKKAGGSNVGEYKHVAKGEFAGPSGGSPAGSYPINTLAHARSALKLAHNAPNAAGIKRAVYRKYPQLKKKA